MASPRSLPTISCLPQKHADCCLSLSTALLEQLQAQLISSSFVLSIGSGTGLFEALAQQHILELHIEGVEVVSASQLTQYLSPEALHFVSGTWDLYEQASKADAWVFVYPRQPQLVNQYFDRHGSGNVKTIIWLGPIVDWQDYEPVLSKTNIDGQWSQVDVLKGDDAGLMPYEMMAVRTKLKRLE